MMRESLNIAAHSGCSGTEADSLESIYAGIHLGADLVEVDVRHNEKAALILSHDKKNEYPGNPFLEEVFDIVLKQDQISINCDIKEEKVILPLFELAAKKGIEPSRLILTGSVSPVLLEKNPEISKKASVWINIEELARYFFAGNHSVAECTAEEFFYKKAEVPNAAYLIGAVIDTCFALEIKALNMPFTETAAPFIQEIKKRGMKISLWTVNDEETLKKLFAIGVFSITTKNVQLASNIRCSFI